MLYHLKCKLNMPIQKIKNKLFHAITASITIILLSAFKWSIVDAITPFLYLPLAGVLWLYFAVVTIVSITAIFHFRKIGVVSLAPVGTQILAILIVVLVPFTNLWLKADFAFYKIKREEVVKKVYSGELMPNQNYNSSLIALGEKYPSLSKGGNEIVVEEHDGKKYVFFFTFRGILDNYAGFIYVPDGGNPSHYSDLNEDQSTNIVSLEKNWFYASHH